MRKNLIVISLFLGVAFDFLFWEKVPGISFAIYVVTCLLAGYLWMKSQKTLPSRFSMILLAPILFFSAMVIFRREPFTLFLNFTITLACMALLVLTYRSGAWIAYSAIDYLSGSFRLLGSVLALAWQQIMNSSDKNDINNRQKRKNIAWAVLRGVILSIPVLLVFGALLASADLVFADKINIFFINLNFEQLVEYIFRCLLILVIAFLMVGIFGYAAYKSDNTKLIGVDKPVVKPFLGCTEAYIILGSVLLLFASFVLVQFQYFFFGQLNISQAGLTYSEYARRGFGELVTVAVFSLMLMQILSVITRRESNAQKKSFSGLVVGLVVLVIIILVSSFQRLSLYESAYGFSRLRTYAHVFMIWLGILLVAVVVLEAINRQRRFAAAAFFTLIGFAATINILNVDAFITRQNIQRAAGGGDLDIAYLASLTSDAVPGMVSDFVSSSFDTETEDAIGAALTCYEANEVAMRSEKQPWQSFNISDWWAEQALAKVHERLDGYDIHMDGTSRIVLSPAGVEYTCSGNLVLD